MHLIAEEQVKACTKCGVQKSLLEFYENSKSSDGRTSWCKKCQRIKVEEIRRSPEGKAKFKGYMRQSYLKKNYGINEKLYKAILDLQQGRCAICGRQDGKRRLHVDHDHATGEVRALLCNGCNNGLGNFKDDPEVMKIAITYLEYFHAKKAR